MGRDRSFLENTGARRALGNVFPKLKKKNVFQKNDAGRAEEALQGDSLRNRRWGRCTERFSKFEKIDHFSDNGARRAVMSVERWFLEKHPR